jgi:Abnormal spindle-like microcephaly-assoc'd, ASPM-SPD-2-Hydin
MRKCLLILLTLGLMVLAFGDKSTSATINHYEYVFLPGSIDVYDMDNNFALVKSVPFAPTQGIGSAQTRGAVASVSGGMMYIAYDISGICCGNGHLVKYNLLTDQIVWDVSYSAAKIGTDSHSISPDGQKIYMPVGESSSNGIWEVIDTNTGNIIGSINSGGSGPHNTITSLSGAHVYLAPRYSGYLVEVDATTGAILQNIGPTKSGTVRPFTIDSKETYAFINDSNLVGFEVGSIATGKILYWVCPPGFCSSGSVGGASGISHGVSLSPDEKELYLIDWFNSYTHVFDVTGLPGSAPVDVKDIPLKCGSAGKMTGEGWLQHSRDGRFVFVGDCGDVIDTATRQVVANMPGLQKTRIFQEVDFQNGAVYFSPLSRNQGGYGTQPSNVNLSSTSLSFGNQTVGTTSTAQSSTLTNNGSAALSISSIAVSGTDGGDFAETNTCGTSVAAGGNCVITVTFTPTATGARSAGIAVTDSDASSPQTVTLIGTGTAPLTTTSLSPTSLTFASQAVGTTSAPQPITLTNTGTVALAIAGISASGDFAETGTCGSSVAAGTNCTISVTFKPSASGTRTGTLSISDNTSGSPQLVSLTGTGTVSTTTASLSPTTLSYASQAVGTTSAPQPVALTNTGTVALAITGISASGDFAETDTCGSSVAAGANCTISVTFKPTASGTRTGALSLTDNATGSPQSVSLTGTGTATSAPVVTLSSSSLTFASQTVGTTSAAQTVTMSNTGNASLTLTSVAASGDFAETNTCGSSLAAGANCTVSVTFKPTASGTRTGALSLTDNAAGSPQSVSLAGTGTATSAPVVTLSSSSLTFASQTVGTTSAAQTVTLSNTGNASLSLTSVAASGDFAETNTCGSSVAAGANCTISVTFKPTASSTRTGALSLTDNAAGSPQSVSLAGTGTATSAPVVTLSSSSLTFASQTVGTTSAAQTVTLSNTGNASLSLTSVAASGDFAETNTCGSSVAAGANCTISVTFKPTASGTRTGALSLTDNAAGSPQSVSLAGTGTATSAPVVTLSSSSLTFASQTVGTTSAAQTVTLSNTGNASLSLTSVAASGDFAETNTCGSSVAAGANCTVSVTFKPTASGTRTGALSLTDNATGSPQSVSLTGTGSSGAGDFSLSASPSSGTVTAGQSATFTLDVTPLGGFNQAVNLACNGAPQAGSCTVSRSSVTLNGSSASTATITVTTTAHSVLGPQPGTGTRWIFPTLLERMELTKMLGLMATLAILLTLLLGKRRPARLALGFAMLFLVVLGSGCAGLVKGSSAQPTGTPAGNYTLTVTGSSATGSGALTHSSTLILTVN